MTSVIRKTLAFLAVPVLIGLGCSSFGSSDKYYGTSTTGKKIVFLVDISGSMEGRNEGNISDKLIANATNVAANKVGSAIGGTLGGLVSSGISKNTTKLASARRELGPAIRGLEESTWFTVITFSDNAQSWKADLQQATKGNKTIASLYVENLSANGGTSALRGLREALNVKGVDTIFFLSDGFPSDASSSAILNEVRRINGYKKVTIYSIGLGDSQDVDFMRQLAEQNGGTYHKG